MANWCTTELYLSGKKANAEKLQNDLERVFAIDRSGENPQTFESDSYWLAYIIENLLEGKTREDYECRGNVTMIGDTLTELDDDHAAVHLMTETAWVPMTDLFRDLAEKYDLAMFYCAEELGCEILETNDEEGVFFSDRYRVEDDESTEFYETFDEVADHVQAVTGKRPNELLDLEGILEDYNDEERTLIVQVFDIV